MSSYDEDAREHSNNLSVRKGILRIIEEVDRHDTSGMSKVAANAYKLSEAVRRILSGLRIGNPLLRAIVGVAVGVVYLIVQIVYAIHKAAIKRRRNRLARGLSVGEIRVNPVTV